MTRNTLARLVSSPVFDPGNWRHRKLLREDDESLSNATPDEVGVEPIELDALRDLSWLYRTLDPARDLPELDGRAARLRVAEAFAAIVTEHDLGPYLDRFDYPSPARNESGTPCRCSSCVEVAVSIRAAVLEARRETIGATVFPIHNPNGRTVGVTTGAHAA